DGTTLSRVSLGMILGGATGNLIDRIRFGAVIDFIDLHYGNIHWPAFNIADAAITVGIIVIMWIGLFQKRS
ncbi:MAG: signal peptidase II, partial [Candidatus Aenigmatarchaeota archaeon]